jgi:hypothetical protein
MSTTNPNDLLEFNDGQKPTLPGSLNVLTILTFIGCGIGFIGAFWNYINAEKGYKDLLKAQENLAEAPAWAKKMMGPEMVEMARKSMENKLPIMLLTVVGTGLCLWGALEMRKLKKQGFMLWTVGEFLPIVGSAIFIGMGAFSGFTLFFYSFPIIFLILYAVNRKHLIY